MADQRSEEVVVTQASSQWFGGHFATGGRRHQSPEEWPALQRDQRFLRLFHRRLAQPQDRVGEFLELIPVVGA